jgi:hypothetical protein
MYSVWRWLNHNRIRMVERSSVVRLRKVFFRPSKDRHSVWLWSSIVFSLRRLHPAMIGALTQSVLSQVESLPPR